MSDPKTVEYQYTFDICTVSGDSNYVQWARTTFGPWDEEYDARSVAREAINTLLSYGIPLAVRIVKEPKPSTSKSEW